MRFITFPPMIFFFFFQKAPHKINSQNNLLLQILHNKHIYLSSNYSKSKYKRKDYRNRLMGKSLPFKSLFKSKNTKPFPFSCHFPSCTLPETPSFRMPSNENKNNDSSFVMTSSSVEQESFPTINSECSSVEAAMRALNSKRLFFDPNIAGKELVEALHLPFEGSIAVEMQSTDMYKDFKLSMKEMIEANYNNGEEVKDAVWFEEMLEWYLRMNVKCSHGYIVKAYVDLLFETISGRSSCVSSSSSISSVSVLCSSSSFTCPSSSYFSCLNEIDSAEEEKGNS